MEVLLDDVRGRGEGGGGWHRGKDWLIVLLLHIDTFTNPRHTHLARLARHRFGILKENQFAHKIDWLVKCYNFSDENDICS